ncbi:MAG: hypothetical protein GEU98_01640 [Pseudonocardiaceae bacterium]|nr:hypothetical protein [Pseudonocardiaceae bacterium]
MTEPEIDPATARDSEDDPDFADEHARPTYRDEPAPEESDESVPEGQAGDGGMDMQTRPRPD